MSETNEIKLKPCPFCGGSDLRLYTEEDYDTYDEDYQGVIECNDCNAYLASSNWRDNECDAKDEITAIWNKRANIEKKLLRENLNKTLLAELKKYLEEV